jgi:hypothetical protein
MIISRGSGALDPVHRNSHEFEMMEPSGPFPASSEGRSGPFILQAVDFDTTGQERAKGLELFSGMLRYVRSLFRLRDAVPAPARVAVAVPRCAGTTRKGNRCKGPAMGNGLCRMHGGARLPKPERPGRYSATAFGD